MILDKLNITPFPFKNKSQVFSEKIFNKVKENWPDENLFKPYADGKKRSIGDAGRFGFYICGHVARDYLKNLDSNKQKFWHDFIKKEFRDLVYEEYIQYLPFIRDRFKQNYTNVEFQLFAVLVNSYKKIEVRVHTDNPSMLITGLLYISNPKKTRSGTTIYVPKDKNFTHTGSNFLNFDLFKKFYTCDGYKNSMLSFLKTSNSFHGVPTINLEQNEYRSTINWHIRLTDNSVRKLYNVENYFDLKNEGKFKKFNAEIKSWQNVKKLFKNLTPNEEELSMFNKIFE